MLSSTESICGRVLYLLRYEVEQRSVTYGDKNVEWRPRSAEHVEPDRLSPALALLWRMIENRFRLRIPVHLLPGPIGARGHHTSHGVRKTVLHRGIRLFAAPQAIQPIDHMGGVFVAHPRWRKRFMSSHQNVFDTSPHLNHRIIFVIALFLHHLPARSAFTAVIQHGGFLAHDARETGCVIAEARRVAH